jgi:hypothetical protein
MLCLVSFSFEFFNTMPPLSSIFSSGNSRPVSSVGNIAGSSRPVSSALGSLRAEASTSFSHGAHESIHGSASIFHPEGSGQGGTTSVTHVMNGDLTEQNSDDVMRDTIRDDLRYRHMRQTMHETQENSQTREQRVLGHAGTGKAFGSTKKFVRRLNTMVRSMPATYKNLSVKDRKYFVDMVKKHAKKLPVGAGFGLSTRKKMKREVFADKKAYKVSTTDAKDFKHLIDELPR